MKRIILLACFLITILTSNAQGTYLPSNGQANQIIKRFEIMTRLHSKGDASALPVDRFYLSALIDTLDRLDLRLSEVDKFNLAYLKAENRPWSNMVDAASKKPLPFDFYKTKANMVEVNTPDFKLYVNPGLNLQMGWSDIDDKPLYTNTRAIEIRGQVNDKLGFYSMISENQLRGASHEKAFFEKYGVFPGAHLVKDYMGDGYDFFNASGYVTFKVLPSIGIQFGQGRNFIGHGQRSLLLSDFATDYLYLKINTRVWHFNYQNIYAKLIDRYKIEKPLGTKYMAAHYLGIDLLKNLNIGFYESVIFHDNSSTGRGFDPYYLNPIIFYRSVEHLLGDPDKMLVGLNASWLPINGIKLYGQLMVNEFRISDLVARNGHSANKFGYQLGIDYVNVAGLQNLDFNMEYNRVRPYSYAHYTMEEEDHPVNSYSHYNQPLAHPLGANFSEVLVNIKAQPIAKINLELNYITAIYGTDSTGSNWGQNILLDYRTYERELGNEVGQGVRNILNIAELTATWHVKHNFFIDLDFKYRNLNSALNSRDSENVYIGTALRLNLERRRWEY